MRRISLALVVPLALSSCITTHLGEWAAPEVRPFYFSGVDPKECVLDVKNVESVPNGVYSFDFAGGTIAADGRGYFAQSPSMLGASLVKVLADVPPIENKQSEDRWWEALSVLETDDSGNLTGACLQRGSSNVGVSLWRTTDRIYKVRAWSLHDDGKSWDLIAETTVGRGTQSSLRPVVAGVVYPIAAVIDVVTFPFRWVFS